MALAASARDLDHCQAWLATPPGGEAIDQALDRSAEVILQGMLAVGNGNSRMQLAILYRVQAMILAKLVRDTPQAEHEDLLHEAGSAVLDEVLRFLEARKRDRRKRPTT